MVMGFKSATKVKHSTSFLFICLVKGALARQWQFSMFYFRECNFQHMYIINMTQVLEVTLNHTNEALLFILKGSYFPVNSGFLI